MLYTLYALSVGAVIQGPTDIIYRPNQGPVELTCNISQGSTGWRVNGGNTLTLDDVRRGGLPGHSVNGTNLLIVNATNNTEYICASIRDVGNVNSDPAYLYIAGTYVISQCLNHILYACIYLSIYTYIRMYTYVPSLSCSYN